MRWSVVAWEHSKEVVRQWLMQRERRSKLLARRRARLARPPGASREPAIRLRAKPGGRLRRRRARPRSRGLSTECHRRPASAAMDSFACLSPNRHSLIGSVRVVVRPRNGAMASQGSAGGRFTRAIQQRNLWAAEVSLRELGEAPSLEDALAYLDLLAEQKRGSSNGPVFGGTAGSRPRRRSCRRRSRSSHWLR
jgi:hypothetical protein